MGAPIIINGNPAQFPVGNDYSSSQSLVDYARGVGAGFVGQPYDVYRCSSSGDYIQDANKILTGFPLMRKRAKKSDVNMETSDAQGTFWYTMFGDLSAMQAGDIYVQNDPAYGIGQTLVPWASGTGTTTQFNGIAEANHAPLKQSIGARVDRLVTIYRMPQAPVASGATGMPLGVSRMDQALPLICTDAIWGFGANGTTASKIPAGFMTASRVREPIIKGDPNATEATHWMIYIPPLNGWDPLEGDRIQSYDGSNYIVMHPYEQQAGLMGSQLICKRGVG